MPSQDDNDDEPRRRKRRRAKGDDEFDWFASFLRDYWSAILFAVAAGIVGMVYVVVQWPR